MNLQPLQDGFSWLLSQARPFSPPRVGVAAKLLDLISSVQTPEQVSRRLLLC